MDIIWKLGNETLGKVSSKNISGHKIYFVDTMKASLSENGMSTLEATIGDKVVRTFKLDLDQVQQRIKSEGKVDDELSLQSVEFADQDTLALAMKGSL